MVYFRFQMALIFLLAWVMIFWFADGFNQISKILKTFVLKLRIDESNEQYYFNPNFNHCIFLIPRDTQQKLVLVSCQTGCTLSKLVIFQVFTAKMNFMIFRIFNKSYLMNKQIQRAVIWLLDCSIVLSDAKISAFQHKSKGSKYIVKVDDFACAFCQKRFV